MDVRMPDGTIVRNVPEGTTQAELASMLKASGKSTAGIGVKPENKFTYGFGDAALQGLTFGLSDEIRAGANSLIGNGTYSDNMKQLEAAQTAYQDANPLSSVGGELLGSVPTALLGGAGLAKMGATALKAAPRLAAAYPGLAETAGNIGKGVMSAYERISPTAGKLAAASATGATSGAITGANTAREGERLDGALRGAAIGATLGPLTTGIGPAAQSMIDKSQGVPVLGAVGRAAGKYIPGLTDNFGERADIKFLQAIRQDSELPQDLQRRASALALDPRNVPDKPMTLADVGGKNVQNLADVASTYPGAAQARAAALQAERQGGQAQRIGVDLAEAFGGLGKGSAQDIAAELKQARERAAGPLYQKAFAEGSSISSPDLMKLFNRPSIVSGYKTAQNFAKEKGLPPLPDIATLQRTRINSATGLAENTGIDLQTMNLIKQGLDDVIFNAKMPGSNVGKQGVALMNDTRIALLKQLDELVPTYKDARMAFAGPAALNEALESGVEFGKALNKRSVADLRSELRGMGPSEKEHFTLGLLDAIKTNMSQVQDGRDLFKVVYGSNEKRQIIKELVGDKYPQLEMQMLREQTMRKTDDFIRGNSATMRRKLGADSLEADTGLVPTMADKGPMKGMMDYILRSATGPGQATADALANPLFSTSLSEQMATLNRLSTLDALMRQRAIKQGAALGSASGTSTGLLGD